MAVRLDEHAEGGLMQDFYGPADEAGPEEELDFSTLEVTEEGAEAAEERPCPCEQGHILIL